DTIVYTRGSVIIGKKVEILKDDSDKYTPQTALNSPLFYKNESDIPNFNISNSTYWIKFTVQNASKENRLLLQIDNALIDTSNVYFVKNNTVYLSEASGSAKKFSGREYKYPDFVFNLAVSPDSSVTYLLKIKSAEQLHVPMIIGSQQVIAEAQNTKDLISGIHIGVLLIMVFYNLFVFFSVRDRSYLFYVLYILFIGLTQISLTGYSYKYLFPEFPWLYKQTIVVAASIAGISAAYFIKSFLNTKKFTPVLDKLLFVIACSYALAAIMRISGFYWISSRMIDFTALSIAVVAYIIAIKLTLQNYRPAKFYLIAWTIFIIGLVLFVLRNLGILPYNQITSYTMQVGTILEVALLSIALADKINIFRQEKEKSQEETVSALKENERIIREQNVFLEAKVEERTSELTVSNNELNKTLIELKETESQLVESEKMASLGQLTAGIAHEINNPINFITSNVNPLKRDVDILLEAITKIESVGLSDGISAEKHKQIETYKEEIDFDYLKIEINHLLKGINDGASRTAEIVKGLRIFSRLDEDDLKKADINEGLDSTLIIVNNLFNNKIKLVKEYGNIPLIECYPGKLNQVFLNIISNAIYAINKQHGDKADGILKISTSHDETTVFVKIEDNGTGMDDNTKKKIFEPFFTTKDVGEGTGLGMSITYNTIKRHNGNIVINSTLGVGSEFILELPIIHEIIII
ncbi:MAG TPA: histidine kinase, partial [Sphingobacteriaceae bacterium]|nr:histidine kinase [Sphingobacteriaceae bacterium]